MASTTKAHMTKQKNKTRALGKARKKHLAKNGSTPAKAKLFGDRH
jgi:hypothetical protein